MILRNLPPTRKHKHKQTRVRKHSHVHTCSCPSVQQGSGGILFHRCSQIDGSWEFSDIRETSALVRVLFYISLVGLNVSIFDYCFRYFVVENSSQIGKLLYKQYVSNASYCPWNCYTTLLTSHKRNMTRTNSPLQEINMVIVISALLTLKGKRRYDKGFSEKCCHFSEENIILWFYNLYKN